jgi:mono/diheme cytochrome c family protein
VVAATLLGASLLGAPTLYAQTAGVEQGKKLFTAEKCTLCHSVAGQGNKKGPLDGVGAKLSDAEFRKWLLEPETMPQERKPLMKAFKGTPAEVDALVAYMLSLKEK